MQDGVPTLSAFSSLEVIPNKWPIKELLYHNEMALVGSGPMSKESIETLLEDNQIIDKMLNILEDGRQDISSKVKNETFEEVYLGEKEVIS